MNIIKKYWKSILIIFLTGILVLFFPLTNKDWFWFNKFNSINLRTIKTLFSFEFLPALLAMVLSKIKLLKVISYTIAFTVLVLITKNIINKKNNVLSFIAIFLFFLLSIYGIELSTILTYPVYALFKKIQILGFIERIENFAGIQIITVFFVQASYLIYYIKRNLIKNKNQKKLTYLIALVIPITSIFIFKNYNLTIVLKTSVYIIGSIITIITFLSIPQKNI